MSSFRLIEKYNVPIPRYTSHPTVPYWKEDMTDNDLPKGNQKFEFYILGK